MRRSRIVIVLSLWPSTHTKSSTLKMEHPDLVQGAWLQEHWRLNNVLF